MQKILIITQNKFHKYTGGGVLLSNLFHKVPKENIYILHRDGLKVNEEPLNSKYIAWHNLRPNLLSFFTILLIYIKNLIIKRKLLSLDVLKKILLETSYFEVSNKTFNSIKKFNPTIIYAWASDSFWTESIKRISARLDLPYVIHFMDNQIGLQKTNEIDKVIQKRFINNMDALVMNAKSIFVISELMSKEYSQRWNKECHVYRGSIDSRDWPKEDNKKISDLKKITYVGSVEKYQVNSLLDIIKSIEMLNKSDENIELNLYLNHQNKKNLNSLINSDFVKIHQHPEFKMLRKILINSDILISFYSFNKTAIDYYRLSFPTKIVPFMLSDVPILMYGPKNINPIEYAKKGNWAEIVDEQSIEQLNISIKYILNNEDYRRKISQKARHVAENEHDLEKNSERFLKSLEQAIVN